MYVNFSDRDCENVQMPYLHFCEEMHLTAYVSGISSPSSFIAQPYGSQLVDLMHELK